VAMVWLREVARRSSRMRCDDVCAKQQQNLKCQQLFLKHTQPQRILWSGKKRRCKRACMLTGCCCCCVGCLCRS
jgi:hypothetical protein